MNSNASRKNFIGSKVPQNREPSREAQPFLAQLREGCHGRPRLCRDDEPEAGGKLTLADAENFAQPAAHPISVHRPADPARRDQAHTCGQGSFFGGPPQHAHAQPAALDHPPLGAHREKFTGLAQPRGGGKAFQGKRLARESGEPEEIRPRCGGRSGSPRPLAGGACGRGCGDG